MANLSLLSLLQSQAQALGGILVSPSDNKGITAQITTPDVFLFDYEGENVVEINSEVTDHYIESNTAIQDQIAIKPVRVITQGFVGELNDIVPSVLGGAPNLVASKLGVIGAYLPNLTVTALLAYNAAFQAYQTVQSLASSVASWDGSTQNKQQKAFQKLAAYQAQRVLFTVQTPWFVYQNMVIESLRAVQDPDTRVISNFNVVFKQLKFVNTVVGQISQDDTRYFTQANGTVTLGANKPVPSIESQATVVKVYGP